MELHTYRPGEREYVAVGEIVERAEKRIIFRDTRISHHPTTIYIEVANPSDRLDDPDVPSKVKIFLEGEFVDRYYYHEFVGTGYFRELNGILDVVMVKE